MWFWDMLDYYVRVKSVTFSFPYPFFFWFNGDVTLVEGLNEDKTSVCELRIVLDPHESRIKSAHNLKLKFLK